LENELNNTVPEEKLNNSVSQIEIPQATSSSTALAYAELVKSLDLENENDDVEIEEELDDKDPNTITNCLLLPKKKLLALTSQEIQLNAPLKYPKIVRHISKGKANSSDLEEYLVKRKPTRPLKFDNVKMYGPHLPNVKVPKIEITPSTPETEPGYLNYSTVEVEMDEFLAELLGETLPLPPATGIEQLLNEDLYLSDDEDEDDNENNTDTSTYSGDDGDDGDDDDNSPPPHTNNDRPNDDDNENNNNNNNQNTKTDNEKQHKTNTYYGGGNYKLSKTFPFDEEIFEKSRDRFTLKYINIIEIGNKHVKKFNTKLFDYKITFRKNLPADIDKIDLVTRALNEMTSFVKRRTNFLKGDRLNIVLKNPKIFYPISTGFQTEDHVNKLKEKVEQILTSDETVNITDSIFHVQVVTMPRGARRTKILNLKNNIHTKRSIVEIKNKDNLCCPRAIVVGLSYHSNTVLGKTLTASQIKELRNGRRKIQTEFATLLCDMLGDYCESCFTLEDIKNVEKLLNIRITIVCAENFNTVIYKGENEEALQIYLYKVGNHFHSIVNLTGFFGSVYYCVKCDTPYQNKDRGHECKNKKKKVCLLCMKEEHNVASKKKIYCLDCNRYCYNQECYDEHKLGVCFVTYKCKNCAQICLRENDKDDHKCGFERCRNCGEEVEINSHQCYMQRKKAKGGRCGCRKCSPPKFVTMEIEVPTILCEKHKCVTNNLPENDENPKCTYTEKYIFFDYEAQQETGIHVPNLVVAHDFKGNKYNFKTNDEFCEWLISNKHREYTAIAHYAKGYDSQFILQYMIKNTLKPYTIYNGTKLMLLEVPHIKLKIIDSHNFIAAPLATFPKTFGLKELKKGYFPHLFNTKENENYMGPLPNKKYYCYDTMKSAARKEFLEWYVGKIQENYIFDMKKEILEYCDSDVDILRRSCLELRREFLDIANIDPFQYITLPSVCMAIFRSKYLKDKTIGVHKPDLKDQYSKSSIGWLKSFENDNIQYSLNIGEQKILKYKVDGFDASTNTVYQFHGCFWHGCPKCYHEDTINNVKKEIMSDLYQKTVERTEELKLAGYNVIEMWECEWQKSSLYKKYKNITMTESLNPRNAYFGGRTEAFKLKAESNKNEKVRYIDVCSLYPTVMFYDLYPIRHPTKIFNPRDYDKNWFGLVSCKVLAPSNLYIPVLPSKVKKGNAEKLLFYLCQKCAETNCSKCDHTTEEKAITGTWTTVEVNVAMSKGYRVLDIYEVWHFESSTNIFKDYIRDFMKIKLESSPHSYNSNEEYAADVKNRQGFELDLNKIKPNPVKRNLAKLAQNSLYGKFGQRVNMTQTEFVTDPCRFYEILLDDKLSDINTNFISDEMIQINYKYKDSFVENYNNINIFIAIYTTANARLRLFKKLTDLGEAVIYCDTDSIVYNDDQMNTVKTGDLLGEWTDELGAGNFMEKWLTTGPKSYYYKTNNDKECTKIKGFTLHHKNMEKLNGEALEKLIEGEVEKVTVTNNQITRDKVTKQLVNKDETKTLSFNFDKRIIVENYDTYPYGYQKV
jgi:hypothetical protein